MKLLTPRQIAFIINSIKKVIKKNDIQFLTKAAYGHLYLCSGFIAHYDIWGFRDHYKNVSWLMDTIKHNAPINQWNNFHPGEKDYDYYMQKKEIYNQILEICNS